MSEDAKTEEVGETPPTPKHKKMVRVINTSRYKSFHLGGGRKIAPGEQGRIPHAMFEKVRDSISWLKRAERGDVI